MGRKRRSVSKPESRIIDEGVPHHSPQKLLLNQWNKADNSSLQSVGKRPTMHDPTQIEKPSFDQSPTVEIWPPRHLDLCGAGLEAASRSTAETAGTGPDLRQERRAHYTPMGARPAAFEPYYTPSYSDSLHSNKRWN